MNTYAFLKSPGEIKSDVARRCRLRRKEKKLSQKQLADKSDVSLGSIKRFEQTGEISLSSLIKISFVLQSESDFDLLFAKKAYSNIQEVIDEKNR